MKILICGSRDFKKAYLIQRILRHIQKRVKIEEIIHGGCRGADRLAGKLAQELGIKETIFPANWTLYGKAAGPIRNREMLEKGKPDLVIAFYSGKKTSGTQNMVKLARTANVFVIEFRKRSNHASNEKCSS